MSSPGWNPYPQHPNPQQPPYPPQGPYPPQNHPPQGPYPPQNYPPQPYPPQGYAPQPHPGQPPLFQMRLTEHTGMLLMWSQRSYTVVGTIEQCEAHFRKAQTYCLAAGWWSIASLLVFNWIAMSRNRRAIKAARSQAAAVAQGHPPRW